MDRYASDSLSVCRDSLVVFSSILVVCAVVCKLYVIVYRDSLIVCKEYASVPSFY